MILIGALGRVKKSASYGIIAYQPHTNPRDVPSYVWLTEESWIIPVRNPKSQWVTVLTAKGLLLAQINDDPDLLEWEP